jgi:hypothetical protein
MKTYGKMRSVGLLVHGHNGHRIRPICGRFLDREQGRYGRCTTVPSRCGKADNRHEEGTLRAVSRSIGSRGDTNVPAIVAS